MWRGRGNDRGQLEMGIQVVFVGGQREREEGEEGEVLV
jgi:hypothetical protein